MLEGGAVLITIIPYLTGYSKTIKTVFNETLETSLISSYLIRVCPCTSNQPYCDITEQHVATFPGGTLHISAVAAGQWMAQFLQ